MRFSVIIPAYNEEGRISATLDDFAANFPDTELIVVVNGSSDLTASLAAEYAERFPFIRLIEVKGRIGKGGAVKIGMLSAQGAVVGFVDADGSTSARELRRLCLLAEVDGAVIASRWKRGAKVSPQPLRRRIASRIFNAIIRVVFGMRFTDTQCGAKAFRATLLRNVIEHVDTGNLAFDVDLLYALRRAGVHVREEPTEWVYRDGSRIALLRSSWFMLCAVTRLRLRHSAIRILVPMFDRLFPTHPIRSHRGLNILILNWRDIGHPNAGGAETYLHEIARRWVAKGHTVEWMTGGFRGALSTTTIDGMKMHRVGNRMSLYFLAPFYYLRKMRDRFDLVIDSENGLPLFSPVFSLKPKLLLIYHVHKRVFLSQLPPPLSWILAFIETRVMPFLYRRVPIVAISHDTAAEIVAEGIAPAKPPVVHCGIDSSLSRTEKSPEPSIVYLGRLKRYKRVDRILRAMEKVVNAVPKVQLHIIGSGPEDLNLRSVALKMGLQNVHFHGFVNAHEKKELLGSAWVFAMASEMEGWGISIIEANACGTPAVAFNVSGVREAVVNEVTGLLVDSQNEFERRLIDVLRDASVRNRLSSAAFEHALQYSWDRASSEMLKVAMDSLMDGRVHLVYHDGDWSILARDGDRFFRSFRDLEAPRMATSVLPAEVTWKQ